MWAIWKDRKMAAYKRGQRTSWEGNALKKRLIMLELIITDGKD